MLEAKGTPLNYKGFKKYYIKSDMPGQWLFKFENNYGASVIKHYGSYGYEDDLFEIAVIKFDNPLYNFTLCYDTPISNDVIGYLTNENVLKYLKKNQKFKGV